jgi:hypothetical protein
METTNDLVLRRRPKPGTEAIAMDPSVAATGTSKGKSNSGVVANMGVANTVVCITVKARFGTR